MQNAPGIGAKDSRTEGMLCSFSGYANHPPGRIARGLVIRLEYPCIKVWFERFFPVLTAKTAKIANAVGLQLFLAVPGNLFRLVCYFAAIVGVFETIGTEQKAAGAQHTGNFLQRSIQIFDMTKHFTGQHNIKGIVRQFGHGLDVSLHVATRLNIQCGYAAFVHTPQQQLFGPTRSDVQNVLAIKNLRPECPGINKVHQSSLTFHGLAERTLPFRSVVILKMTDRFVADRAVTSCFQGADSLKTHVWRFVFCHFSKIHNCKIVFEHAQ